MAPLQATLHQTGCRAPLRPAQASEQSQEGRTSVCDLCMWFSCRRGGFIGLVSRLARLGSGLELSAGRARATEGHESSAWMCSACAQHVEHSDSLQRKLKLGSTTCGLQPASAVDRLRV